MTLVKPQPKLLKEVSKEKRLIETRTKRKSINQISHNLTIIFAAINEL